MKTRAARERASGRCSYIAGDGIDGVSAPLSLTADTFFLLAAAAAAGDTGNARCTARFCQVPLKGDSIYGVRIEGRG